MLTSKQWWDHRLKVAALEMPYSQYGCTFRKTMNSSVSPVIERQRIGTVFENCLSGLLHGHGLWSPSYIPEEQMSWAARCPAVVALWLWPLQETMEFWRATVEWDVTGMWCKKLKCQVRKSDRIEVVSFATNRMAVHIYYSNHSIGCVNDHEL